MDPYLFSLIVAVILGISLFLLFIFMRLAKITVDWVEFWASVVTHEDVKDITIYDHKRKMAVDLKFWFEERRREWQSSEVNAEND